MEQDLTGLNEAADMPGKAADIPSNLPDDIDEPGSAEIASDLLREEATGPVPLGPATSEQGEDAVLFVETIDGPELVEVIAPTDEFLMGADVSEADMLSAGVLGAALAGSNVAGAGLIGVDLTSAGLGIDPGSDLRDGAPWYQSRWMYLGAGLVVAATATLGIGSYVLIRNRNRRSRGLNVTRLAGSLGRVRLQPGMLSQGRLSQLTNQLSGQAGKWSGQAQGQLSRLARTTQGAANLKPLQQQLTALTAQAGGQLRSLGATTRATTTGAVGKAQESLSQVGQGVATSASMAQSGLKHGWKLGRNFTLGATAGMLWSYLYAPQDGETTRQHIKQMLPPQLKNE